MSVVLQVVSLLSDIEQLSGQDREIRAIAEYAKRLILNEQ